MAKFRETVVSGRVLYAIGIWGGVLLAALALTLSVFRYSLNPDGLAYADLARQLAQGDISGGLSAYWSVLYPILMVPFTAVGIDPAISARLINAVAAVVILILFRWLVARLGGQTLARGVRIGFEIVLALSLIPMITVRMVPDLVFAAILMAIVCLAVRVVDKPTVGSGVALGLVGALAYWTKGVGFYLFPLMGLVLAISLHKHLRALLKPMLAAVISWLAGVVPLVAYFSAEHGELTISSAGSYTLSLMSPTYPGDHFINFPGLLVPANAAYSAAWTDPTQFMDGSFNPLASLSDLSYYINGVLGNLQQIGSVFSWFGPVLLIGLAALIVLPQLRAKEDPSSLQVTALGASALALVIGFIVAYAPTLIQIRYIWVLVPLALLGIVALLRHFSAKRGVALLVLAASGLLLMPRMAPAPLPDTYQEESVVRRDRAEAIPTGARAVGDQADYSFAYAAYYGDFQYCGFITPQTSVTELKNNNITYLMLSTPSAAQSPLADLIEDHFELVDKDAMVYRLVG